MTKQDETPLGPLDHRLIGKKVRALVTNTPIKAGTICDAVFEHRGMIAVRGMPMLFGETYFKPEDLEEVV